MDKIELATLVREVRDLQKRFFRQHDGTVLERCKELEKRLDAAVDEILTKQPRLFD